MVQQNGLYSIRGRSGHRSGQRVAFSVFVLQKRRRSISGALFPDAVAGRHSDVLHGTGARSDADDRRFGRI